MADAPQQAAATPADTRGYMVLRLGITEETTGKIDVLWVEVGVFTDSSAPGARRQAAESLAEDASDEGIAELQLVAVPVRNWQPRRGIAQRTFEYSEPEEAPQQLPGTTGAAAPTEDEQAARQQAAAGDARNDDDALVMA